MKQAFPLQWPIGYQRTTKRNWSRFDQTMSKAQKALHAEVKRIGGSNLIVSTNCRVKQDGFIYAADLDKKIEDPGVAIYFDYKGQQTSMCCDKYERVWENMYALARAIDALRSIERWGVSDFLNKAFTGFTALPEPGKKPWYEILGCSIYATDKRIKDAYIHLAKKHHPDAGGDKEKFQEIQEAYYEGLDYFRANVH